MAIFTFQNQHLCCSLFVIKLHLPYKLTIMKIEYTSLLISILAIFISILSWFIIHVLNQKRDFANKRKELRIKYLITAWELLESASNRKNCVLGSNLEKAIASIQLFGTSKQIHLSQKYAKMLSENTPIDYTELLNELRDDLRKELNLDRNNLPSFISLRIP